MKTEKNFGHWLKHNGKEVVVDGVAYVVKARVTEFRYPCGRQRMVTVFAAPVGGDPAGFSIDVLNSDPSVCGSILGQCQFQGDLGAVPFGC